MNASQEKALFHLTGQSDLSKIQESTLKQMAAEYPYFAPVHLFLAEKCHDKDAVQFEAASQKANLYFTNPYWLHFQLNSQKIHQESCFLMSGTIDDVSLKIFNSLQDYLQKNQYRNFQYYELYFLFQVKRR